MRSHRSVPAVLALISLAAATLLLVALPLAGCSDDDQDELSGTQWTLRSAVIDGSQVFPGVFLNNTVVEFSATTYTGDDNCNGFGGDYRQIGIVIEPSNQWRTEAVCIIGGYTPVHFDGLFDFDVRGDVLTVSTVNSTHLYDRLP